MTTLVEEDRHVQWMLAGMTMGDSGSLERPLPDAGSWQVPQEAEVHDGALHWRRLRAAAAPTSERVRPTDPNMLDAFVRLFEADDDSIRRFALRWGLLHGDGEWLAQGSEPLAEWRAVSNHFDGLLDVAARLHRSEPPHADRWERLGVTGLVEVALVSWPNDETDVRLRHQLHGPLSPFARECSPTDAVGHIVSGWLRRASVGLGLVWDERPQVVLRPQSLLGGLALQLAFAVARSDGLAFCSACGRPFTPTRKPVAGRRSYCPTCGVQAARRDAQRDYRRRARKD